MSDVMTIIVYPESHLSDVHVNNDDRITQDKEIEKHIYDFISNSVFNSCTPNLCNLNLVSICEKILRQCMHR